MINYYRRGLKTEIKVVQRNLSKVELNMEEASEVKDGVCKVPLSLILKKISLCIKIRKLHGKLENK